MFSGFTSFTSPHRGAETGMGMAELSRRHHAQTGEIHRQRLDPIGAQPELAGPSLDVVRGRGRPLFGTMRR